MFVGHYGIAFALKKTLRPVSLGFLFLAVQLVDIVWTILILSGIEHVVIVPNLMEASSLDFVSYPFTHGLLATIIWGALVFLLVYLFSKNSQTVSRLKLAVIFAIAVSSHFVLDLLTHRPDLPLAGDSSQKLGLGLWNYAIIAFAVEAVIFAVGLWLYLRHTSGNGFAARFGMIIFALVLLFLNSLNFFGPPPDDISMIAVVGLAGYILFAAIAFWLDKKRQSI